MHFGKFLSGLLVCGLLAGFAAGCSTIAPAGAPEPSASVRPASRTAPAGEGAGALPSQPVYTYAPAQTMVRETLDQLLRAAGTPGLIASFTILDSPSYNAALQGNRLFVTRGLLALMNDRAELAAILAHEMGHAIAGHARRRVEARNIAIANTMDVARTFRDRELTSRALEANQRGFAAFSRLQEHEADRIGIDLMAKAGFDPRAAVRGLRTYERVQGLFNTVARINARRSASPLATHPSTPERIALARRHVAQRGKVSNRQSSHDDRTAYLASIAGIRFGGAGAGGFIRGRVFVHHDRDIAITMPAGYVPTATKLGIASISRGGTAIMVFAPMKQAYAQEPARALRLWMKGLDTPLRYEPLPGRDGAVAVSDTLEMKRRIALIVSNGRPYTLMHYSKKGYAGFDRDFRASVNSIRSLTPRDLALARPRQIAIVPAQGPGSIARYAKTGGDTEYGAQLLLALNGLSRAADVKPGMQLKVLVPVGAPLAVRARAGAAER